MHPGLKKSLAKSMKFLVSLLDEEEYKRLLEEPAETCCEWLVKQNRYILIGDEHWDKVFTNIENDINSFGRYYSLLRVKMDGHGLVDMCKALMINDELYEYSRSLMNQMDDEE